MLSTVILAIRLYAGAAAGLAGCNTDGECEDMETAVIDGTCGASDVACLRSEAMSDNECERGML